MRFHRIFGHFECVTPWPRILDQDYNLVIAPIMQRRSGQKLVEIKHGDLAPGKAFSDPSRSFFDRKGGYGIHVSTPKMNGNSSRSPKKEKN